MSKTLKRMIEKQRAKVAKTERSAQDYRELRKRGPKSGDLGRSFERTQENVERRLNEEKRLLRDIEYMSEHGE